MRLGRAWELARRVSPTRPHPTVSRRPPGNALSGLPLSVLDRGRDRLDAFVEDCTDGRGEDWAARGGRALSGVLARLAGLVERTPPARHGDTAATHR